MNSEGRNSWKYPKYHEVWASWQPWAQPRRQGIPGELQYSSPSAPGHIAHQPSPALLPLSLAARPSLGLALSQILFSRRLPSVGDPFRARTAVPPRANFSGFLSMARRVTVFVSSRFLPLHSDGRARSHPIPSALSLVHKRCHLKREQTVSSGFPFCTRILKEQWPQFTRGKSTDEG